MLNKYLEKIAEDYSEDRYVGNAAGAAVHALGLGHLAVVGGTHLGTIPIIKDVQAGKGNVNKSTLRKILKGNRDLDVTFSRFKATKGTYFDPNSLNFNSVSPSALPKDHPDIPKGMITKSYIYPGNSRNKNFDYIAHELGHIKAYKKGKYQQTNADFNKNQGIGSLAGSALLAHPATAKYAWTAPLLGSVPSLVSEGHANRYAYNMIKQHGGSSMANKFLRRSVTKNMLGYAAPGIANSALLYGMHKLTQQVD